MGQRAAQEAISQFTKEGKRALDQQKLEAVKSQEADEEEMISAQTKKSVQAADTFAEQQTAHVQMSQAAAEEQSEKRSRAEKQKVEATTTAAKLVETQRKEKLYDESTAQWQQAKHRARDKELNRFKEIEKEQEKELQAAHNQKMAVLKSAGADRDARKAEATK